MFVLLQRHSELKWGGYSPAAWLDRLSIVPAGVEIAGKDNCYLSFHYYSINIERICSLTEFKIVIKAKAAESVKHVSMPLQFM